MRDLGHLTEKGLRLLITFYDDYIQSANSEDKYESGWHPVCINEFINAELLAYLQDNVVSESKVFID